MTESHRVFAILPAAGEGKRMGRPKLLLPLGETTVIDQVVRTLRRTDVQQVIVVVRPDDEPLKQAALRAGAKVVQPATPPADMRESVQLALDYLTAEKEPDAYDGWLLIPADHPLLKADVVERMLERWREQDDRILVPTSRGRRGHPTLFRWALAEEVPAIPSDQGLNRLVRNHADEVRELPVETDSILLDLDTPRDYKRLLAVWGRTQD